GKSSGGDRPAKAFLRIKPACEDTASVASESPHEPKDSVHEKGRSGGRCGLSEKFIPAGDRLVVVAAIGRAGAPRGCGRFRGSPARRRCGFWLRRRHRGLRLGSGGLGSRLPFLCRTLLRSLLRSGSL